MTASNEIVLSADTIFEYVYSIARPNCILSAKSTVNQN